MRRRCGTCGASIPAAREQELRDFLGGFDFRGGMVDAPVERFSGGEKARLVLAMIVRAGPQLLLLDEPTNHLDIEMREALAEALQDFDGALVVVAHDRHLLARDDRHAAGWSTTAASRRSTATSTTTATGFSREASGPPSKPWRPGATRHPTARRSGVPRPKRAACAPRRCGP